MPGDEWEHVHTETTCVFVPLDDSIVHSRDEDCICAPRTYYATRTLRGEFGDKGYLRRTIEHKALDGRKRLE